MTLLRFLHHHLATLAIPGAALLVTLALPGGDRQPAAAPGPIAAPSIAATTPTTAAVVTAPAPPSRPAAPADQSPGSSAKRPSPRAVLREAPLAELVPEAAALAQRQPGRMTVSVLVPERNTLYTYRGDELFHMASVVKLVILLATIDRAEEAGRPLTLDEREWLEPMITWSDNDSADVLWWRLGGAAGAQAFLGRHGLTGFEMDPEGYWGDSFATPRAVAQLLAALVWGDLLPPWGQTYARELLENVTTSQRWGATGTAPPSPGDLVGVKGGWYPEEAGWVVNSAGYLQPAAGSTGYAIAVLSDRQEDFDEAVEAIEAVGNAVRRALRGA